MLLLQIVSFMLTRSFTCAECSLRLSIGILQMKVLSDFKITILMIFFLAVLPVKVIGSNFSLEFSRDTRSFVDSTRKDYYQRSYTVATTTPVIEKKQYDRLFAGVRTDMIIALRGDLSDTAFFDIEEQLVYRRYDNQDYTGRGFSSMKLSQLDHQLNARFGIAAGQYDYFQLDYYNDIRRVDKFESLSHREHAAEGLFSHRYSDRLIFNFKGGFESRRYRQDFDADYDRGFGRLEILAFFPGKYAYEAKAASTRGNIEDFQTLPLAWRNTRAVRAYTDWVENPDDRFPGSKYVKRRARGDTFVNFFTEGAVKDYDNLDYRSSETSIGVEAAYEIADDVSLRLYEKYRKTEYNRTSMTYFFHENYYNRLLLAATFRHPENLTQRLMAMNEIQRHKGAPTEDFDINTLQYEAFYIDCKTRASAIISGLRRRYKQPAIWYADENELRFSGRYDYMISNGFRLNLGLDHIRVKYPDHEDYLYSDHTRKTYRAGIERIFSFRNSLELAFARNQEDHKRFFENNIDEKSVSLNWISRF